MYYYPYGVDARNEMFEDQVLLFELYNGKPAAAALADYATALANRDPATLARTAAARAAYQTLWLIMILWPWPLMPLLEPLTRRWWQSGCSGCYAGCSACSRTYSLSMDVNDHMLSQPFSSGFTANRGGRFYGCFYT